MNFYTLVTTQVSYWRYANECIKHIEIFRFGLTFAHKVCFSCSIIVHCYNYLSFIVDYLLKKAHDLLTIPSIILIKSVKLLKLYLYEHLGSDGVISIQQINMDLCV